MHTVRIVVPGGIEVGKIHFVPVIPRVGDRISFTDDEDLRDRKVEKVVIEARSSEMAGEPADIYVYVE